MIPVEVDNEFALTIARYFQYLSIGFIIFLPFNIYRYIKRSNYETHYIDVYIRRGDIYVTLGKILILLSKINLLLSPLLLFFVPVALYIYLGINILFSIILMTLYVFTIIINYLQYSWIIKMLSSLQELHTK